jgi:SAM-dependent methyltransferase
MTEGAGGSLDRRDRQRARFLVLLQTAMGKQRAPAAERNAEPIRAVLERVLPAQGLVLEIASGTGQHAVTMARAFPHLSWQPSDADELALESIGAWREEAGLAKLLAPVRLDVMEEAWPVVAADAVVCINMIHIASWECALGLFRGAGRVLPTGGLLYLYGPYRFHGRFTAESNAEFDASLRARDAAWGVRDLDDIEPAAAASGLVLEETVAMPANNHSLVFRRRAASSVTSGLR